MKQKLFFMALICKCSLSFGQDWNGIPVPANAGTGKVWELQAAPSDDFNYTFNASTSVATINGKWTNYFHNAWTGPSPTVWKRENVLVADGNLKCIASRVSGTTTTNLGCITSTTRVIYPVYVETYAKICNSVLASDVWMLSPDETQEIDILEAYGSDRYTNEWFGPKRVHLSHHVFIRSPFTDWQPSDVGSFYTDGSTVWRNAYHRIGVYWKDPLNLEYYVDGVLVRTRSGLSQIDPNNYTGGTGLSKEMDIIINTEDQTWRANTGLTPTDAELLNTENNTFKVDWIRVYKPVDQLGLNDHSIDNNKIKIFPNPFTDSIQLNSENKMNQFSIYETNGKKVVQEKIDSNAKNINTKNMGSGVYLLKIQTEDGVWTTKKIIKK